MDDGTAMQVIGPIMSAYAEHGSTWLTVFDETRGAVEVRLGADLGPPDDLVGQTATINACRDDTGWRAESAYIVRQ